MRTNLATFIPDSTTDGFTLLVPESDVLIRILTTDGIKGLSKGFDQWTSWEGITGTDIHPFIDHYTRRWWTWWRNWRWWRRLGTGTAMLPAFTEGWSTFDVASDDVHFSKRGTGDLKLES